jgi:hypothetical protein
MLVKELFFKLGIKSDQQDFKKAEKGMENIVELAKKAAVTLAAIKFGKWIKGIADQVANLGDQFDKMALRTGVAAQALQELGFAAELSGANIITLEMAIRTLQKNVTDAANGAESFVKDFRKLGVNIKDSSGNIREFESLLPDIAQGLSKITTESERSAIAQRLFGDSGTQLLPLFKTGAKAIREMVQEFRELGAVIDEDLQKQSTRYIDNQARMSAVYQGLRNVIAKQLLPVFSELTEETIAWFKQNRKWIALKLGNIFRNLGRIIKAVSRFFSAIVKVTAKWIDQLSPLHRGMVKISAAVAGLAILLSLPAGSILLLIGLIALLIEDFQTWREGGESVIGALIDKLEDFLGIDVVRTMTKWWNSIDNLLGLVAKTLTAYMIFFKELFTEGFASAYRNLSASLARAWEDVWKTTKEVLDGIWFLIKKLGNSLIGALNQPLKNFVKTMWDSFVHLLDRLWDKIVDWSNKIINKITAPFRKAKEFVTGIFGDDEKVSQAQRLGQAAQAVPVLQKTVAAPTRRFITRTSNNAVNVTVNAAPGMSEQKLAKEVTKQVSTKFDQMNRAAIQALVPAGG